MDIIAVPSSLGTFLQFYVDGSLAPAHIVLALPSFLSAFILAAGKKSLRKLARFVFTDRRDPGTVSRMLGSRNFRSRDMLREAVRRAIEEIGDTLDGVVTWLVAIDGTSMRRGAHTKIKGANQYRISERTKRKKRRKGRRGCKKLTATKKRKKKGRETKAHTFLMGLLITHDGTRIPLPRYTCDPKGFKRQGRPKSKKETQLDLAQLMMDDLLSMVPRNVKLVVTADAYFEGKKLIGHARRRRYAFIVPAPANRCFGQDTTPYRSNRHQLYEYGYSLLAKLFERIVLRRGQEGTASYRRYTARKPGRKDRRTFEVYREERIVAGLGKVAVCFSKKSPVYDPKRDFRKKGFKVLICNDLTMSAADIAEFYDARWTAIEVFFREAKQRLGLGHYTGQSLEALERYVDLVLLSFLFLEMRRRELLAEGGVPDDIRRFARFARTTGMQELLWVEVSDECRMLIERAQTSERSRRLLMRFLRKRRRAPDIATCSAYAA